MTKKGQRSRFDREVERKAVKKKLTVVAKYASSRDLGKVYQVKRDANGKLSCDCPGWVYTRRCKHVIDALKTIQEGFVELTDIPTYPEMQRMQQDLEYEAQWMEAHIKPKQL